MSIDFEKTRQLIFEQAQILNKIIITNQQYYTEEENMNILTEDISLFDTENEIEMNRLYEFVLISYYGSNGKYGIEIMIVSVLVYYHFIVLGDSRTCDLILDDVNYFYQSNNFIKRNIEKVILGFSFGNMCYQKKIRQTFLSL
jgi:hypothetical protein